MQISESTTSRVGAYRQSWREKSPRALLSDLVDEHQKRPGQTDREYEAELLQLIEVQILKNVKAMRAVIEYWFANNYRSLVRAHEAPPPEARKIQREAQFQQLKQAVEKKVDARAETKARVMLMDLMMPNGKRLRACTGRECTKLGFSVGRWLSLIGKSIEPTQRVGEVLSEDKLHKLYEAAS